MLKDKSYINKLDIIHSHFLNVLSNHDEKLCTYILNFIACSFAGRKLRKALYFQSDERTGKGIIFNDLLNKILGDRMHKTNSIETITKYTKPLEGISLLNLDELPHTENFKGLQDIMKGMITEPTFTCRDMYTSGYTQINSFNIILTTNNDAIILTQNNKERYIICEIDESYKGNLTYFQTVADTVKDPNVRILFYNQMMERFKTLDNWNEDFVPESKFKQLKIIEALPPLYKYLKEKFILKNIDLDKRTDDFITDFQTSTSNRNTKQAIGKLLAKINVKVVKLSNNAGYKYKMTCAELIEEFNKNKWMDEANDFINPDISSADELDNDIFDYDDEPEMYEPEIDYKKLYEDLLKKNEDDKKPIIKKVKTTKTEDDKKPIIITFSTTTKTEDVKKPIIKKVKTTKTK